MLYKSVLQLQLQLHLQLCLKGYRFEQVAKSDMLSHIIVVSVEHSNYLNNNHSLNDHHNSHRSLMNGANYKTALLFIYTYVKSNQVKTYMKIDTVELHFDGE